MRSDTHTKEDEEKTRAEYDRALAKAKADVAAWDTSLPEALLIALQFLLRDLDRYLKWPEAEPDYEAAERKL
jgi:hypothetical protein